MPRTLPAVGLILILIVGSGLRIWAASGDLWIDEVWSLNQMHVAASSEGLDDWIALFFHSNTHALNTIYLRLIDGWFAGDASPLAYRSLSLTSGIASLVLVSWWGWKRNPVTALIMATLFAFSYPMINYSGEARGYGPMILAILGASYVLQSYLHSPTARKAVAFSLISLLGLLSHLTFVIVQAGLGFWALAAIYRGRRNLISTTAKLVPLFGLQLVAISAYGAVALNNMVRGGDCCPEPALDSIRIMADWAFGVDAHAITSLIPLFVLTFLLIIAIVKVAKDGDDIWIALTIIVIIFPLITLIIETKPDVIHRYYLPSVVYAVLITGAGLAWLWQEGSWKRGVSAAVLGLFCLGNVNLLVKFSDGMRGQYSRAIQTIVTTSVGHQRISGYPKFSVGTLVRHHVQVLGFTKRLEFVDPKDEKATAVDWYINGYLDGQTPKPEIVRTLDGIEAVPYALLETYPQWGLSGDTWALYRRSR